MSLSPQQTEYHIRLDVNTLTYVDWPQLTTVQFNCFWQNEIDSSAEHNRASTTHCFASRSHSVVTWAGRGPLAKLRIKLSPDVKLRLITWRTTTMNLQVGHTLHPINHNNTQHLKGNQRAEQHHLLNKTIKYFNCYTAPHLKTMNIVQHTQLKCWVTHNTRSDSAYHLLSLSLQVQTI